VAARVEAAAPPGCLLIDRARLARTGALAITAGTDGWQITSAREVSGARPWNSGAARGRD